MNCRLRNEYEAIFVVINFNATQEVFHRFCANQHYIMTSFQLACQLSFQSTACVLQMVWVQILYRPEFFRPYFSLLCKQCSLLRRLLSYSPLYMQFTYMIFTHSQSLKYQDNLLFAQISSFGHVLLSICSWLLQGTLTEKSRRMVVVV